MLLLLLLRTVTAAVVLFAHSMIRVHRRYSDAGGHAATAVSRPRAAEDQTQEKPLEEARKHSSLVTNNGTLLLSR